MFYNIVLEIGADVYTSKHFAAVFSPLLYTKQATKAP